jgi:hypothetical protein
MHEPREQLERIAVQLALPLNGVKSREIDRFAGEFLDENLRHSSFSTQDLDAENDVERLTNAAYLLLYDLASDRRVPDDGFWASWRDIQRQLETI